MDGKTQGLIVGRNFVVEESEIIGVHALRPTGDPGAAIPAASVTIYLRAAQSIYLDATKEDVHGIYHRVLSLLKLRNTRSLSISGENLRGERG